MVDKLEIFMKRPRMGLIKYLPCMMKIDYHGMICNIFRQWTILRMDNTEDEKKCQNKL